MICRRRVVMAALVGTVITVALGSSTVSAHPLGNFSVNHAHALAFSADGIVDDAVVDSAEIPTAQAESAIDTDGDGTTSPDEMSAYGQARCDALVDSMELTVDDMVVAFTVTDTSFERLEGAAGLTTTRLECRLDAAVDLTGVHDVNLRDDFESSRVGWHEITAVAAGVQLADSPVPTRSTTDGLRNYPVDLLSSPLDVRTATFRVEPGTDAGSANDQNAPTTRADAGRSFSEGGPLAGVIDRITGVFDDLVGRRNLSFGVGLLAVMLATVLGASHAVLPGHGKTVMAAYIAGRQGTARDAFVVGATVTATHTGGVLILGLALTASSSLAGETVLAWLGIMSGLLIASLGASLLIATARHRTSGFLQGHHHHSHGPGHTHNHDHDNSHDHDHGHSHDHGDVHDHDHDHDHSHAHDHDHDHSHDNDHGHSHDHGQPTHAEAPPGDGIAVAARARTTHVQTAPTDLTTPRRVSRRALVGMGVAGGLVPSPSALVVLLSAIALGRTAFGVLLIIGYGLGMAATLTAAGLLLVRVRDRYERRAAGRAARGIGAAAARWSRIMPYATAALVLLVGLGLAVRSLNQLH